MTTVNLLIEEKQLPIDEESKARLLDLRIRMFYDASDDLSERLYIGDITIGEWEESMRQNIRQLYSSSAAIGKGGWDNMDLSDWGRLGNPVKAQYQWLHNFAEFIEENKDDISLQAIQARARLYGDAGGHAAILMQAGRIIANELPYIPRDGTTECLNRCHCIWNLLIIDNVDDFNVIQATWRLGVADHCETCISRDGHVEIIRVHELTDVPDFIGGL